MIEKLELKHLAHYLPYKLPMVGCQSKMTAAILQQFIDGEFQIMPILRPLSDLTEEIECEGQKFVPMKKLYSMYETRFWDTEKYISIHETAAIDKIISCIHMKYEYGSPDDFILKYHVPTSNMGDLVYSFTYAPKLYRFVMRDETNRRPLGIAYQIQMFEKLFEWNLDVFGLIDKGLAVSIYNTNQ